MCVISLRRLCDMAITLSQQAGRCSQEDADTLRSYDDLALCQGLFAQREAHALIVQAARIVASQ